MKSKKAMFSIISLVLVIIILVFVTLAGRSFSKVDYVIFSDISECQAISTLNVPNSELVIHSSNSIDECIENLSVAKSFCASYSSPELSFDIYAHEFFEAPDAKAYFKNVSGRASSTNPEFFASGGMTSYYQVVIDGKNAYTVKCSSSDSIQVKELLLSIFEKRI